MECRKYYNEDRPHGAIGNKPPVCLRPRQDSAPLATHRRVEAALRLQLRAGPLGGVAKFPTCRLRARASLSFRVWVPIPDLRTNPITRDAVWPVQLTRVPINRIVLQACFLRNPFAPRFGGHPFGSYLGITSLAEVVYPEPLVRVRCQSFLAIRAYVPTDWNRHVQKGSGCH
jgi:hypothetical protein